MKNEADFKAFLEMPEDKRLEFRSTAIRSKKHGILF